MLRDDFVPNVAVPDEPRADLAGREPWRMFVASLNCNEKNVGNEPLYRGRARWALDVEIFNPVILCHPPMSPQAYF